MSADGFHICLSSGNSIFFVSLTRKAKKCKTISACTKSTDLIAFKKISELWMNNAVNAAFISKSAQGSLKTSFK
jgi:hypothetical protein